MASVFHYTDAPGLLGILSSEALFASDYRFLNDAAEGARIRDLIMPILESEVAEITPRLIAKGWLQKSFYTEYGAEAHRLQAESMYRAIVRATDNVSPAFVLSFCRHEKGTQEFEHGLLSQWRGYAAQGGFAIEFDEGELDAIMKIENEQYAHAALRSNDVSYGDHGDLFDPEVYKGVAGQMIWDMFKSRGIDANEITGHKDIDAVALKFITTAPFLKHWGFHEEREYRIIALTIRPTKMPEEEKRRAKDIKFRARDGLVVPYIEMFEMVSAPFPVKSIIVGPHPHQTKQAEAVKMVLEREGLDAIVRLSEIPYRK
jgi:hypothetical protein